MQYVRKCYVYGEKSTGQRDGSAKGEDYHFRMLAMVDSAEEKTSEPFEPRP